MKVSQYHFKNNQWSQDLPQDNPAQLILAFGSREMARDQAMNDRLAAAFPNAQRIGCTTSGEILSTEVYDESLAVTAIELENSRVQLANVNQNDFSNSFDAGEALAKQLPAEGLRYVLVISDGQSVNGTELVDSLNQTLPQGVLVTGGMAGDGDRFQETLVWHNDAVDAGKILACGFYGESLKFGHGSLGGWNAFGPQRTVTRAQGNVLFELDDQPALELYKKYLGEFSEQLPSSALRFPLSLTLPGEDETVVRTILNIDEADNSMVFAGDMPVGAHAQLMRANFETLIDGASEAAEGAVQPLQAGSAQLALLISCVGRRLVLNQRVYEELEAVEEIVGEDCPLTGFYSYGELSPLIGGQQCRLHNQTMTITTISEEVDA